ncbi:uncharacterized protein [Paramormyrops kingsleyae]
MSVQRGQSGEADCETEARKQNIEIGSDDRMVGRDKEALRPGDPGFCAHARVPVPSNKDYVVRPKWNADVEANRDEDCEAEGEAHDNQSNDEHITQNEYDLRQGDSDSENGLHDSHLEQGVSRPTASDRNEVDLLKRRGSSEDDEPKQLINDNDTEEQMSVQRGQSGEADCETEARKQNIEIVSDDRMVGRDKGKRKATIESDSEEEETLKQPAGRNQKENNQLEQLEESDDRKAKAVKRKLDVLPDSEDEEHEKKPIKKESLLLDGEISASDGGLQSSEKSMAAKLQELGSGSEEDEDGKRTEFGKKDQKNLFSSDSDSVDEEDSGGQTPRRDLEKVLTGEEKALRPGDPGFCAHARVPVPSNKDYIVCPKWNAGVEANRDEDCEAEGEAHDNQSNDEHITQNEYDLRQGDSDSENGLHDSHLEQGVSRSTASDRNEVDLLKRRGSSEDDEPKQLINDNDTEEQMSVQRGQSGEADCETEARKQNIEIVSDDRMVGRDKGKRKATIESDSEEEETLKQPAGRNQKENNQLEQLEESDDRKAKAVKRKLDVLPDSEDEEHEKKPIKKESLLLDGEISTSDGGLQSSEKSMAAKLQELGSDIEEDEDGKRTEFGKKDQKNLFSSDSDSVDEEEKMIAGILGELGDEEEEEITGFQQEDLEEEKSQSGVSSGKAAVKDSDSDDAVGGGDKEALRPGDPGFCAHARVPVPSNKDYIVCPKWNAGVEANRDEDCEAEGEAHDNQSNDEHITQNEYDLRQGDSDSENGLHDSHLEQGVSRSTASDRNEVDLLKRRGNSEDDEPKQLINDNDTEEQMSVQRGQSGEADCETEARKQNIEIVSDDRMVGRDKGKHKAIIESDSEEEETLKQPAGRNQKENNQLEQMEESDDRKAKPVKRKLAVLFDSEDEEHEKKPIKKESLLLDGEISTSDGGLQSSEKFMAAKLQELGSDSEEDEDGKRTEFGKKDKKNLFSSDSDSVDEEEKMMADVFGESGDEEEEEFMGFKQEDLEEEKSQSGVSSGKAAVKDSDSDDAVGGGDKEALRHGDPGFCAHARVPVPSNKDYIVRPKWNADVEANRQVTDASWKKSKIKTEQEPDMPPQKMRRGTRKPYPRQTAKDGTVWVEEDIGGGTPSASAHHSRFTARTGPTKSAKRKITSVLQSFLCLFDMGMLQIITECTVHHAHRTEPKWKLTVHELMAFISILFVRAVMCPVGAVVDCWSENFLVPVIKETMSRDRFISIMQHLRFDKHPRTERVKADRFVVISDIWTRFTKNCVESFTPGEHITIDEQLFPTKVRCPFTQYISSKPDKFGIKFWLATDLETKYVCNASPYLGKDPNRQKGERLAENVVMSLMEPFLDKGRNVTTDNFFTSLSLSHRLLQRNTTLLGTVNKVRRELPPSAKDTVEREEFSTSVLRNGSVSLTIYSPKKKKTVCLMSSLHRDVAIGDDKKRKPNTITDYNHMKCGVDVLDQMARMYSVRAPTRRWPVAVFYNMLDLAAVNAYVLYKGCTGWKGKRRLFLSLLAKELRNQFMQQKAMETERKAAAAAAAFAAALPRPVQTTQCQVQESCNRNRSRFTCVKCHKFTCGKCRDSGHWICKRCTQKL